MDDKIPKIIHYCWFGRNPLDKLALKCIASWKSVLQGYEIVEWNEDNFDIGSISYVKEAYDAKKFAFVSDYVRLHALYNNGGIYMDVDVEVKKSFDCFLHNEAFLGFENRKNITTGVMACKQGSAIFKEFLNYYKNKSFYYEDGVYDLTTNVEVISNICRKHGFIPNNKYQELKGFSLYPNYYFCPSDKDLQNSQLVSNIYAIHYFAGSWLTEDQKIRLASKRGKLILAIAGTFKKSLRVLLGKKYSDLIYNKIKKNIIRK